MKKQSPETLFDELAENYESMRREVDWDPFLHIGFAFRDRPLKGMRILDAGCGDGECTRWFQSQGAEPVGLDISGEMCYHAAEKSDNILFLNHDMNETLPFEDDHFDGVVALGCMEYLPDIASVVRDFYRVIRHNGLALCCFERFGEDCPGGNAREVEFYDHWMRYRQSREELSDLFSALFDEVHIDQVDGFILEETDERTRYWRVLAKKPRK